jgi:hypothetical protein
LRSDGAAVDCDSNVLSDSDVTSPGLFNCSCAGPDHNNVVAAQAAADAPPPPPPPVDPNDPTAQPAYDDSAWELIDTPHDMGITGKHSPLENPTQGFLPRSSGWYRKHFTVPADWCAANGPFGSLNIDLKRRFPAQEGLIHLHLH